ncbi:unnamed protein product, partial [Mesorhabditis spiculigera]
MPGGACWIRKHIRKTTRLEWIFFTCSVLQIIGRIAAVTYSDYVYYVLHKRIPSDRDRVSYSLAAVIAIIFLNSLWCLLTIITFILTVIGMRKRIVLLAHAYPVFLSIDIHVYSNNVTDGIMVNSYYDVVTGFGFLLLISVIEWLAVKCWAEKKKQGALMGHPQFIDLYSV